MNSEVKLQLAALLSDDDPAARRRAAEDLSESSGFAPIAALAAALRDENKGVRDSALRSLSRIGNENVARAAVEYIADENIVTRNLAAELLMRLKDHSVGALLPYLYDVDQDVRKFAVDILGLIGNDQTVDHILPLLDDADENVVVSAAEALGNIKSRRAVSHLIRVFKLHDYAKAVVAESLGKIGDEEAGEFLLKYLSALIADEEADRLVLYSVIDALGLIGGSSAVQTIREGVARVSGRLRLALLHTLIRILDRLHRPLSDLTEFRGDLLSAIQCEDCGVRISAARALGEIPDEEVTSALVSNLGQTEEIDAVILPLLEKRPEIFRVVVHMAESGVLKPNKEVIALLGRICSLIDYGTMAEGRLSDLSRLLESAFEFVSGGWAEASEDTRGAIVDTMLRLDADRAFEYLASVTEEPDPWLRIHVIELVAPLENRGIPEFIARFLSDDDEMVREVAASTLESKGYSPQAETHEDSAEHP